MKVSGPGKISSPTVKKAKSGGKSGGAAFSLPVGGTEASAPHKVAGASPLTAVDALLGLQEVPDATSHRSKGLALGHDLLDSLEEIQRGLLLGTIPIHKLKTLANLVKQREGSLKDPALAGILDEIELRARVELAKFEMSQS